MNLLIETDLKIPGAIKYPGKVSDVYFLEDYGDNYHPNLPHHPVSLRVFCDRVSANNARLTPGIPNQGVNLARLAEFWSDWISANLGIPTHFITADIRKMFWGYKWFDGEIADRSIITLTLDMLPIENITRMVVRAAGSGWKQYCKDGTICGIQLPAGLKPGDMFPETLWTPTEKSATDPWITREAIIEQFGPEVARLLEYYGLLIQHAVYRHLACKGLLLPDNKTEWGRDKYGRLRLADEYLSFHSACFYLLEPFRRGELVSMDKDLIRVFLDANPGVTTLPDELVQEASRTFDLVTKMIIDGPVS